MKLFAGLAVSGLNLNCEHMIHPLITDAQLRAALEAMKPDRIQGFTYDLGTPNPVRVIRDVFKPYGSQEIFRCMASDMTDEQFAERCAMERLRVGLQAALELKENA